MDTESLKTIKPFDAIFFGSRHFESQIDSTIYSFVPLQNHERVLFVGKAQSSCNIISIAIVCKLVNVWNSLPNTVDSKSLAAFKRTTKMETLLATLGSVVNNAVVINMSIQY